MNAPWINRGVILLLVLASTLPVAHTIIIGYGDRNDIVLLTAPVWVVKANLTGEELVEHIMPTDYKPEPEIILEPNGSVVFNASYHVYLNVGVEDERYWVVVAKIRILEDYSGRPPRGGVGGYAIKCIKVPCPRASYWISVINVYPSVNVYQLQGHYSKENGKWLFSTDYKVEKGQAYTIFFARIGEYVAGGLWGVPDSTYYYRDNVVAPIITAYGLKMRVYWVAILVPGNSSQTTRIVEKVPETTRNGVLLGHTGYYILLEGESIVYKTIVTTTITRRTYTTITITKTRTVTRLPQSTTTITVTETVTRSIGEEKNSFNTFFYAGILAGISILILGVISLLFFKGKI